MNDPSVSLPFTVPDLFAGLAEGSGLANASPAELTLEFMVKDNILQVLKSGVKEIRIPQSEIASIELKQGWFRSRLTIRLKSMKWLADLPTRNQAELILHIKRRDRDQVVNFARILGFRFA